MGISLPALRPRVVLVASGNPGTEGPARLVLVLIKAFLFDNFLQAPAGLILSIGPSMLHLYAHPFESQVLDQLQTAIIFSEATIIAVGLLFNTDPGSDTPALDFPDSEAGHFHNNLTVMFFLVFGLTVLYAIYIGWRDYQRCKPVQTLVGFSKEHDLGLNPKPIVVKVFANWMGRPPSETDLALLRDAQGAGQSALATHSPSMTRNHQEVQAPSTLERVLREPLMGIAKGCPDVKPPVLMQSH